MHICFGTRCCCRSTNGPIGVGVENMWLAKVGVASGNIHMLVSSEEFLKPSVKLHKNLVIVYSFSHLKRKKYDRCFGMALRLSVAKIIIC